MTVFAFSCHPDDIEFMMAGTLLLLKKAGCTLHYMNLADGSLGSTEYSTEETARIRRGEAMNAAAFLGATYHESLVPDLQVYYRDETIRKVTAVTREVKPDLLLLPSPEDYMEDHMNTCRDRQRLLEAAASAAWEDYKSAELKVRAGVHPAARSALTAKL